jgi:hypothetical protein
MQSLKTVIAIALWVPIIAVGLFDPSELLAFSVTPSTLTFTAASGGSTPATQTVALSKKTLVAKNWTVTETSP